MQLPKESGRTHRLRTIALKSYAMQQSSDCFKKCYRISWSPYYDSYSHRGAATVEKYGNWTSV